MRNAFPGVSFPTASSALGVHCPRAYLTRYVPLSGFLSLLAAYSSASLAGLFHPADTPGILPFRAFSSHVSRTPYRSSLALLTLPSCRPRALGSRWGQALELTSLGSSRSRPCGRLQGFAPTASSFMSSPLLTGSAADALLGFCLSKVFPFLGDGATFVAPPLVCLPRTTSRVAPSHLPQCTSEYRSPVVVAFSLSRAPLPF